MPVIIDTDPGLDDVIALLLALASPELDILGIVTVGGNIGIDLTTRNALRVLGLTGRTDIPVVAGASKPWRREAINASDIHGEDGIGGIDLPDPRHGQADDDALDWMVRTIESCPDGKIRLLTLGPLTNVARLLESRPQTARKLAGITSMGGAVRDRGNITPHAEFNIAADPEAADIVIRSGIPFTLVPLDVTRRVSVDSGWGRALAEQGGKIARMTAQCIDAYIASIARYRTGAAAAAGVLDPTGEIRCPLHDPCVTLWALQPDLFTTERLPIRIVTDGSVADGATVIDSALGTPADVLTHVDSRNALALAAARLACSDE